MSSFRVALISCILCIFGYNSTVIIRLDVVDVYDVDLCVAGPHLIYMHKLFFYFLSSVSLLMCVHFWVVNYM